MAEGSVNLLLSKLAQILEEEGQLLTGVRTEAEYISDELEFMKAFLRVADAMEERDPRLEVLVKKVRDIAYETEDALDDFKLRLTHDRGQRFFAPLLRSFDYSVNLRARHQIASRIRAIKARVIGISEAHRRYLIRNNIMGQGSTFSSISRLESQGDGLLLEEADLVGIDKPKRQLIEWLLERKSGREVVSVVGMGGLGKSTLVKKVYDDPDVKKQFKFRAWITVSQSFKKEELLKDIIQQLFRVHRKPGPKVKEEGLMWSEKVRRVSMHKAVPSIQRRHVASRLRSVLIFWGADSCPDSPAPNLSFGHLRLLNVLDLEGAPLKEFPSKVSSLFLLKYLSLRNTNVNSIPSSISKLLNLETLDLKYTQISELPVEILKLRKLRHLLVYRYEIDSDDRIRTKYGFQPPPQIGTKGFQRLKFLGLNKLESLRVITVQQGAMPCLEKLIVQSCKELKRVPSGIEHLTMLKVLEFFNMPKELIMTLQPSEENGDCLKVAHVPDVYSTYWNNGILDNFTLLTKEDGSPARFSPSGSRRDYIW
ncbi:hypothetical protein NC651_008601 [Populus alba x Populus x berolinensis]|nr:hypothetical protein NC651_008601 [Populus alba x Populus x berolinensis]